MSSLSFEDALDILRSNQAVYMPGEQTAHIIRPKVVIPVIGPVATGKSTVITAVCRQDSAFFECTEFTTRPIRGGEQIGLVFRFLPHDAATLTELADKLQAGRLVQYAVHPTTGYIYGTEAGDYPGRYNMIPMLTSVMPQFARLPFAGIVPVTVVCTPDEWQQRFDARAASMTTDERTKRIREAAASLQWSLKQQDMHWIWNQSSRIDQAARRLISFVRETVTKDSPEAGNVRHIAAELHRYISDQAA